MTAEQPKSWWGAGSSTVTAEQPRSWVEGGNYELQNRVKDLTYKKVSSELRTRRTLRTLKDGYMSSVESRYIQLQTRVREGQYNASGVAVVHNMGPSGPCCRRRCQRYRAIRPAAGSGGGGGSSSAEAARVPPPPPVPVVSVSAAMHPARRGSRSAAATLLQGSVGRGHR